MGVRNREYRRSWLLANTRLSSCGKLGHRRKPGTLVLTRHTWLSSLPLVSWIGTPSKAHRCGKREERGEGSSDGGKNPKYCRTVIPWPTTNEAWKNWGPKGKSCGSCQEGEGDCCIRCAHFVKPERLGGTAGAFCTFVVSAVQDVREQVVCAVDCAEGSCRAPVPARGWVLLILLYDEANSLWDFMCWRGSCCSAENPPAVHA